MIFIEIGMVCTEKGRYQAMFCWFYES